MTITEQYSATTSQATSAVEKMIDFWAQGARALGSQGFNGLSPVDMIPAVERYFEFVQRTVDLSRDFTLKWVEAGNTLTGVAREQAESVSGLLREQAQSVSGLVHEQADQVERATREQAAKVEQAEREVVREVREVERDQARQAHEKARERYKGKTEAELRDLLDRRNLPKTGTVDELVDRLVEADGR